jgi:hypothetical protein
MRTLTFKINNLEVLAWQNDMVNIVKTVHYSAILTEKEYSAELLGSVDLTTPEPYQFINYDELSQELVLSWIKPYLDLQSIENSLVNKLNSIKNPTIYKNPPWIN